MKKGDKISTLAKAERFMRKQFRKLPPGSEDAARYAYVDVMKHDGWAKLNDITKYHKALSKKAQMEVIDDATRKALDKTSVIRGRASAPEADLIDLGEVDEAVGAIAGGHTATAAAAAATKKVTLSRKLSTILEEPPASASAATKKIAADTLENADEIRVADDLVDTDSGAAAIDDLDINRAFGATDNFPPPAAANLAEATAASKQGKHLRDTLYTEKMTKFFEESGIFGRIRGTAPTVRKSLTEYEVDELLEVSSSSSPLS